MDDLFYTGRRRRTGGTISVTMRNGDRLAKKLKKLEDGGRTAVERTVSDFASRAPAWVSKGIRKHYGVDTAAIKKAGPRIKRGAARTGVSGISVDGVSLEYRGRTLTPVHFNMSPKTRQAGQQARQIRVPGQAVATAKGSPVAMMKPPKKYTVKAAILKGGRASMEQGTFIAEGRGGVYLPFQRTGEGRTPIEAVRTLSVPQMISGRAQETIDELISTNLEKRFEHHIQQAMK